VALLGGRSGELASLGRDTPCPDHS
jgi:hypothetical protein